MVLTASTSTVQCGKFIQKAEGQHAANVMAADSITAHQVDEGVAEAGQHVHVGLPQPPDVRRVPGRRLVILTNPQVVQQSTV